MDEDKIIALCAILLVVVVIVLVVPSVVPTNPTHYEESVSDDEVKAVKICFDGLVDTNLTLTFLDDPELMYSVDFTAYSGTPQVEMDSHSVTYMMTDPPLLFHDVEFIAASRLCSLKIGLGNGIPYFIEIRGFHLNSTIVFSNSAAMCFPDDDIQFTYVDQSPNGVVRLLVESNLTQVVDEFSTKRAFLTLSTNGSVIVDFTPPEGVIGVLILPLNATYTLALKDSNWTQSLDMLFSYRIFRTGISEPSVQVSIGGYPKSISLWLR